MKSPCVYLLTHSARSIHQDSSSLNAKYASCHNLHYDIKETLVCSRSFACRINISKFYSKLTLNKVNLVAPNFSLASKGNLINQLSDTFRWRHSRDGQLPLSITLTACSQKSATHIFSWIKGCVRAWLIAMRFDESNMRILSKRSLS